MNEVDTDDIENIEHQLNKYFEEHKTLMSEKALKDVIDIIYQFISTDFVIPDMCVYKAVKYTDRDTYQAMEALIHNLNTMASRAGAQVNRAT
jgi:ribonucleoside-triphosphate reductase